MSTALSAYGALFLSAFLAATLLPASSELLLGSLLSRFDPLLLWLVATSGNSLGALLNWGLGRYALHYRDAKWFPIKPTELTRAQQAFQHFGVWSLLFAWLPLVGDALTLLAGVMRVPPGLFMLLVSIGKGARYAVVIVLVQTAAG